MLKPVVGLLCLRSRTRGYNYYSSKAHVRTFRPYTSDAWDRV